MNRGSTDVIAWFTAAQASLVDSRATGSSLPGSAMSSWYASQSERQAPEEVAVAAIRSLSRFHSRALLRTNCRARAAASKGVRPEPHTDPGRTGRAGGRAIGTASRRMSGHSGLRAWRGLSVAGEKITLVENGNGRPVHGKDPDRR